MSEGDASWRNKMEVAQRRFERLEFAAFLRPLVEHSQFKDWFEGTERKAVEALLKTGPTAHDDRLAFQTMILALRDMRRWMELAVQQGRADTARIEQERQEIQ